MISFNQFLTSTFNTLQITILFLMHLKVTVHLRISAVMTADEVSYS